MRSASTRMNSKQGQILSSATPMILNVPVHELVFVKNATTGVHTVLQNLRYQEGDVIIYFATVYGAVEKIITALTETTPLQARKVEYTCPISHKVIVQKFQAVVEQARSEGLNVKAAVFDTVTSLPGMRFPFEELTRVCKQEGIFSVIDGAHGIGHIPLDLNELQPDFFTSNLHKWLYVPRGCAALYVPVRHQHLIRTTLPTSWGFIADPTSSTADKPNILTPLGSHRSAFEELFQFVATSDDAAYLTVPDAVRFRADVCGGHDAIFQYLEALAIQGGDIVAAALGTDVLQEPDLRPGEKSEIRRCGMSTVRLPIAVGGQSSSSSSPSVAAEDVSKVMNFLQVTLKDEFGTFVPVFQHGDWLWTRVSAQVYLEPQDFEWLGGVLRGLVERVWTGEHLG
ncbi:pyridoxal phosphate-dependent transferase [Aspergillus bertholletiae]|uniref:Pyridoxal phosphate-dependent transferase n=1 Tax=Aspergillus bertholletiae TaxID=1226010 RepID=A0A5N7B6H5_9EURO|nr:pyridoxal phosphate-dependent transferase [Aspergillus bertholletiae]